MKRYKSKMVRAALAAAFVVQAGLAFAASPGIVLVGHSPDSDPWWNPVRNGMKQAGEDFGMQTEFRNPPNGDLADMTRILETAAARGYAGVGTTIPDFDVVKGSIQKITAKGIPIVTFNTGTDEQSVALGAIMHVGQSGYVAGHAAGEKAKQEGIKSFVCVDHEVTNEDLFQRCKGFADALGVDSRKSVLDAGKDPIEIQNKTSAWLRNHPGTGAILALGPLSASGAIRAVKDMGLVGKIWFTSFDFSEDIANGIKDGTIKYAIDQQPYLQGYIPVAVLAIAAQEKTRDPVKIAAVLKSNPKFQAVLKQYGLEPNYGPRDISTGPHFISRDNLAPLVKYAGQYR